MAFQSIRDINPNTTQRPRSGFDPSGFSNIGRDPSVPPQLRRDSGINTLPSGPDIRMKSKPAIPTPAYNLSMSPRGAQEAIMAEYTRQKFFDGRPDITRDRLERRRLQEEEYNRFKQTQMKPVVGASNLYQSVTPGGPTLSDEANRLANIYGPTPKELMSDIVYGAKNLFGGIAKIPGQLMQAYQQFSPLGNILSKVQEFGGKVFNPYDISGKLQMAGPEAQRMYAMYMQQGMPYQQAFELATGQKLMFNGGIASLR
jgi:hypothetical protein